MFCWFQFNKRKSMMARAKICIPCKFEFQSYVTGHHIYKKTWTPVMDEELLTETEPENPHDKYAVKVAKNEQVVGHIPRELSKYCTTAMLAGGTISCKIAGKRENKRGNGLEVPCIYKVKGPKFIVEKVEMLIVDYLKRTK